MDKYDQAVIEWIEFFSCKTEQEVAELNAQTKNPGIKEAIAELLSVNASSLIMARHEAKLKAKRDRAAREEFVWDSGVETGIERGKMIELTSIVRKKMNKGLNIEEISQELEKELSEVTPIYQSIQDHADLSDKAIVLLVEEAKKNRQL